MEYNKLGNSDLEVSVIGIGTWAIGSSFFGEVDDSQSVAAIRAGIESGINLIDTAPAYGDGHAEEVVGQAIKGYRDDIVLATKCGVQREGDEFIKSLKPEKINREINESLKRLGVDVIDLYQIHWPDGNTPLEDSVYELLKLKKAGKFKYLGVSNFDTELLSQITGMTDVVSVQPQYSILSRDIEDEIIPYCLEEDIGIMSYGSLGGGILTGKYTENKPELKKGDRRSEFYPYFKEPHWSRTVELVNLLTKIAERHDRCIPQVALNWVRQQPGITTALVGVKSPEQAQENAAAGEWKLSKAEIEQIESTYNNIFEQ